MSVRLEELPSSTTSTQIMNNSSTEASSGETFVNQQRKICLLKFAQNSIYGVCLFTLVLLCIIQVNT